MMEQPERCPECGADWLSGKTCQDHFHQMLVWEMEDPSLYVVHHLLVVSYHLQHPSLYSPEGFSGARVLLREFVDAGMSTEAVRKRDKSALDSGRREFKVTGSPEARGAYDRAVKWTMCAADVVAGGMEHYVENVSTWARSINEALKQADCA